MNVICREDCGNAPKKLQLKDITIACARGDLSPVADLISEKVTLNVVGKERYEGTGALTRHGLTPAGEVAVELRIHQIITHGWIASINGTLAFKSGGQREFCDVYVFSGAGKSGKVKEITSYRIDIR